MIYIYTDGSSEGGRGGGGYSWIVTHNGEVIMAGFGGMYNTTNNIMELTGALEGLEYLIRHPIEDAEGVTVVTDSQYVIGSGDGSYTPKKNLEYCHALRETVNHLDAKFLWVRGHNGNQMNEIADELARLGRRPYSKPKKKKGKKK